MKVLYVRDIFQKAKNGEKVKLLGWIKGKRTMGRVTFLDITDSTGNIQCILDLHYSY